MTHAMNSEAAGQLGRFALLVRRAARGAALAVLMVGGAAQADTLADALVGAYNHSGLLEQNRALLRAADEDVASTVAGLRPIINWSADITRSMAYGNRPGGGTIRTGDTDINAGITAELLLYDFGQQRLRIDAAKEAVLATRQTLVSIEQQVLLRAVAAYMNVLRNTRFVELRRSNVRVINESLRAARDRFEVGEVTRTDVAQAEARLASARSGLANAEGDLNQAIEEYIASVGKRPGTLARQPRLPEITRSVDSAKQVAMRNHPDMLKAQFDVASADINVLVAEAAVRPRVTLNGSLGVNEEFNSNNFGQSATVGVRIGGPIYQGGLLSSTKRRALAQRDALRGALHVVRNNVSQNVGVAYAILAATRSSAAASSEAVRAARVAFDGVREEAKLGARTTLDVLNAEQELLDAQANQISAQADVFIAAYQVLASTGQLTARQLNLGVQSYDPTLYYNLVDDAPVPSSQQGKQLDKVLRALGKE